MEIIMVWLAETLIYGLMTRYVIVIILWMAFSQNDFFLRRHYIIAAIGTVMCLFGGGLFGLGTLGALAMFIPEYLKLLEMFIDKKYQEAKNKNETNEANAKALTKTLKEMKL
jgi:hypothetical protein